MFQKGKSGNPVGRQKGVPNKVNSDIKAMILAALDRAGGADYLLAQSESNATAFLTLVGKVLPMTVAGDTTAPLVLRIERAIVHAKD